MSTEAIQRAFEHGTYTGTRAQLLTYLSWKADRSGIAWPKRDEIASALNCTPKHVKRLTQDLVDDGALWYRPGRGRGNPSLYVPLVGLEKGDIAERLRLAYERAGLEKGDIEAEVEAILARRKGDIPARKGDNSAQKGDMQTPFSEKGTSEKRGHPGAEKGTSSASFPLPPMIYNSNPPPLTSGKDKKDRGKESVREVACAPSRAPAHLERLGWVGWLPPGHEALRSELPANHPAVSERHLRYWQAARTSIELLRQAEEAIESFRIPAMVRRKMERDPYGLTRDYADIFRLIEEEDGYPWSEIQYAMNWLFTRSDWLRNGYIASIASLRKKTRSGEQTKFEAILTQAHADDGYQGPDEAAEVGSKTERRKQRQKQSAQERIERATAAALSAVGS